MTGQSDLTFIIDSTPRLAKISFMAATAFGLADGANRAQKEADLAHVDGIDIDTWQQAVRGYQHNCLMMAAIDINALFDRSSNDAVSFQTVYHRLKNAAVKEALIAHLYPSTSLSRIVDWPEPLNQMDAFFSNYSTIDWNVIGRLKHFRNLGVAHLLEKKHKKSITYDELRTLTVLALELAKNLQGLCGHSIPIRGDEIHDSTERGFMVLRRPDLTSQ